MPSRFGHAKYGWSTDRIQSALICLNGMCFRDMWVKVLLLHELVLQRRILFLDIFSYQCEWAGLQKLDRENIWGMRTGRPQVYTSRLLRAPLKLSYPRLCYKPTGHMEKNRLLYHQPWTSLWFCESHFPVRSSLVPSLPLELFHLT